MPTAAAKSATGLPLVAIARPPWLARRKRTPVRRLPAPADSSRWGHFPLESVATADCSPVVALGSAAILPAAGRACLPTCPPDRLRGLVVRIHRSPADV